MLNRRAFLRRMGHCACGVTVLGAFPNLLAKQAYALGGGDTKVLFVNMNGGWDGLSVLQPTSGQVYNLLRDMRPTIARAPDQLLTVSPGYGFHPHLTVMKQLFDEGSLGGIMKVGYEHMSRSHEESEVAFARGVRDRLSGNASGFIARLGDEYQWSGLTAVSVSGTDRAFEGGEYRGIQVDGLWDFYFQEDYQQSYHETLYRREMLYSMATANQHALHPGLARNVSQSFEGLVNTADQIRDALESTSFSVPYPDSWFGSQFRDVDVLFSNSAFGTRIGYMRHSGFDTHSDQNDTFNELLPQFNQALGAFVQNMKSKGIWQKLIVVLFSEFGRTNEENASGGTDHGGAVPVFLLGGRVRPGLTGDISAGDLTDEGWLPVSFNIVDVYRQVLAAMDYDPDRVFDRPASGLLPALFR